MISVCMATYNGSKFIEQQLNSILSQLNNGDEIIITDDCSTDDTLLIIDNLNDLRIKVFKNNKNLGVVKSFENSIQQAKNSLIFLSDQDDIWHNDKIKTVLDLFLSQPDLTMVYGNGALVDEGGISLKRNLFEKPVSKSFIKHLIQPKFLGCSVAFKKTNDSKIFPFPSKIPMHDWWIGMNHIAYGKVQYIHQPLIDYRRHSNTVTNGKNAPLPKMIYWRYKILSNFILNIFK